jgi:phage/plasmid primase, P4 family, C-terminal domain
MRIEEVLEKLKREGKINYFELVEAVKELEKKEQEKIINYFKELLAKGMIEITEQELDIILKEFTKVTRIKLKELIEPGMVVVRLSEDAFKDRNVKEIANSIAQAFITLYHVKNFVRNGTKIGTFAYRDGVYVDAEYMMRDYFKRALTKYAKQLETYDIRETSLFKEFRFIVRNSEYHEIPSELPPLICFKNGVLNWSELVKANVKDAVLEPSPSRIVFNFIPHELRSDVITEALANKMPLETLSESELEAIAQKYCPNTLKCFKDWVNERWLLLFELIGFCLYPGYPKHKAIMLVGDGANGKSTYLRLVRTILGAENTTSISLQDICTNRFAPANLYNKLANIYPDIPKLGIRDTGIFKALVGEDTISADRKFKERITFMNFAKLFFSANELPYVSDMSYAFWRRWIVIQFKNKFEKREGFFEQTFTESEIEGAIAVSILAFRNVLITNSFSFEEKEGDYKEIWLRNSDSVYAFISDMLEEGVIEKDELSKEETQLVYALYSNYCTDNDLTPVDKRVFTMRMEAYGFPLTRSGNKKYYKNIRIVSSVGAGEDLEDRQSTGA